MPAPFISRPIAVFLSALGFAHAAHALDDEIFFTEVPTVYSASRMPQQASDAPTSVTVIDRDMIRGSGARAVSDLLRLVPGFQVTTRNLEMPARVTYHGLSTDDFSPRLQVLIDGRSQFSALFFGGVNWDLLPVALEDIERIEVIRGSNVAAYGTNAFMGVVNIITMDASQTRGTTVSASAGNGGIHDEFVRFGGQVGDASLRMSYRQQGDEGIRFNPPNAIAAENPRSIANNQNTRLFDLRADMPLNSQDELRFSLGKIDGRFQVGRSNSNDVGLNPPRTREISSQYVQLGWHRNLSEGNELSVKLHSTEDQLVDNVLINYAALNLSNHPYDYGGRSVRDEAELQHNVGLGDSVRAVWGLGARQERINLPFEFHRGPLQRNVHRLFGQLEWHPGNFWAVNLGVSFDQDSLSKNTTSPRASVSYQVAEGHTIRAGVSRAYRIPTMYEQSGWRRYSVMNPTIAAMTLQQQDRNLTTYKANGSVNPEQLDTLEIGYYADMKSLNLGLDVRAFDEYIPNRMQVVPTTDAGDPKIHYAVNAENTRVNGVEYQLRWQPSQKTRVLLGQSFTQISVHSLDYSTRDGAADFLKREIQARNSAPQMATSLMLMQTLPGQLEFSVLYTEQESMKWTPNTVVPAYSRTDWRLAYPFKVGARRGELAYTVQSFGAGHVEFNPSSYIEERHWLSLRFDL